MMPGTMFYKYQLTESTIIVIINAFGIVRHLNVSHIDGWAVVSYCDFNLYSPDD